MLESQVLTHSTNKISIPGKVFVMGEYAVLKGAPAWVAAIQPRFEWSHSQRTPLDAAFFPHPQSPAGKYLDSLGLWAKSGGWFDPYEGLGGFGGSTAEFLAAMQSRLKIPLDIKEWHRLYQQFSKNEEGITPSGADLIAQKLGGILKIKNINTSESLEISPVTFPAQSCTWLVFSASHLPGRKTKTHEHLAQNINFNIEPMIAVLDQWESALQLSHSVLMGEALVRYAEVLQEQGLEHPEATQDRLTLLEHPDVLGVKGSGAYLSDAVIVLLKSVESEDSVIKIAESRGLQLITRYLGAEGLSSV